MYLKVGRQAEAIALLEHARDAQVAGLGADHIDTLATLNKLASAYLDVGRQAEAIVLLERARDACIARFGNDHPSTLATLAVLAQAYLKNRRLPEAIALFERVRDTQVARLGPDHVETLAMLNNLGAAYWQSKRFDKSVPVFEALLKQTAATLGRRHPRTQMAVANLGVNYKDAGRPKEAIPLLEEAHQAAKRFPTLGFVGPKLIDAYIQAGENAKLADLFQEQLTDARKTLPKDSPQLAGLLAQIGTSLVQQKKWTDAEPLLRECLALREKTQPDNWSTFNTKSLLGGVLLGQKKYTDAEPLLLSGYEGLKQREKTIPPQGQIRLPDALERLIQFYQVTNKPDEVAKWSKELDARSAAAKQPEKKP